MHKSCSTCSTCPHAQVLFAGLMSGLTLGLMSMDIVELEVLRRSGSETEAKQAERIIPVIKDAHFLLVTLLLCNAAGASAGCMSLHASAYERVRCWCFVVARMWPDTSACLWGMSVTQSTQSNPLFNTSSTLGCYIRHC